MTVPGDILLGTSGWTYRHWSGSFFPTTLDDARRLEFYAEHFPTVELNASYYRWPSDAAFASWARRLPPHFRLTVKAPKALTHVARLDDPAAWTARIATSLALLGDRAGPLLVQLPPSLHRDDALLDAFLSGMPPSVRVAMEFRHDSWLDDEVFALLEARRTAYVVASGPKLTTVRRATTDLAYVRWHGPDGARRYGGCYTDEALGEWAITLREWAARGRRVYGYFNNDIDGYAVANARTLTRLSGARADPRIVADGPPGTMTT